MSAATALRRTGFRRLLAGQTVSALGDWMGTVALMALVHQQSGSSTAVGGVLALRLLPAAIGGPLAARAAGRGDRRRTMVSMDVVRAAMIAVVPFVRGLWWIYLWAFMIEVASIVFLPARDASVPDLVDPEDLEVANGLVLASSYGTIPLGAGCFALVAALPASELLGRPLAGVFWVDAATFLVSAVAIAALHELGPGPGTVAAAAEPPPRFRDAFRLPLVRAIVPTAAAVALGLGSLFSLGIVFVRDVLGASDAEFGVLIVCFGVGGAAGLALLQAIGRADRIWATRTGVLALGLIVAGFSLVPGMGLAFVGAIAFGAGAAWTLASAMSVLQARLDGSDRVLAFTAYHVVIRTGLAVAALGAGVAAEAIGTVEWPGVGRLEPSRVVMLCSGLLVALAALRVSDRAATAGAA